MSPAARAARAVALEALRRVEEEGAYANLVLRRMLDVGGLSRADRAFVTDLVYGTTRWRRACDFLVDRFLVRDVEPDVRRALRLGAYQLHVARTPPHAAVRETVEVAPRRARGLVNAVLRRLAEAESDATPVEWPDEATRLSYPAWIVDRLVADLGERDALAALSAMNEPATVQVRDDGYVQDLASQRVAESVGASTGERIGDLCAAPGGKATALAERGAWVVAGDVQPGRTRLVVENAQRLGPAPGPLAVITADARQPPLRVESLDRVLIDTPCSGLGTLRRRPDARWRVTEEGVDRLAALQRDIVDGAVPLVRPGGTLVYSVCTMTKDESIGIDDHIAHRWPELEPVQALGAPWRPWGRGVILLPQDEGTDGMALFRYRRRA